MQRIMRTLAITGFTTLAATSALAGNAGASLPACINHVIDACNENSAYPGACAESGITACEEYHAATTVPLNDFQVKIQELSKGKYKVTLPGATTPKARFQTKTSRPTGLSAVPATRSR